MTTDRITTREGRQTTADTTAPAELRRRQREAVDAAVFALETPPGGPPRPAGLRTQEIATPGPGKTLITYQAARRLEPRRRVLVLAPTLNLLTQTVAKWREYGMTGPAVAVCSLDRDPEVRAHLADDLDVRCTTNPLRLALWAGTGPVTVFARPHGDHRRGQPPLVPRAHPGGSLLRPRPSGRRRRAARGRPLPRADLGRVAVRSPPGRPS
ncbi:DEAD/DEAH box helicase family protein, partial [Streptomyces albus]|uniref:DEAD/DEAH box helicase family protein n=1 Tax=Streptomyces albus TaxID=1888 RepID=UPI003F1ADE20